MARTKLAGTKVFLFLAQFTVAQSVASSAEIAAIVEKQ
jgi:hypothetical protein